MKGIMSPTSVTIWGLRVMVATLQALCRSCSSVSRPKNGNLLDMAVDPCTHHWVMHNLAWDEAKIFGIFTKYV